MAIGRLSVTVGHAGEANTWFDYVMRQGIHAPEDDDTERVIAKDSGNMPDWAKDDPRFFWEMADEKEPYANGTTYRQHIVTLPRGLSDDQLIELAHRHMDKHNQGRYAYTFAIHCPIGMDGKEQPHLHYMFNEKIIDGIDRGADTYFKRYNAKNPEKGGGKKDNTGLTPQERDIQLEEVRQAWEVTCNEYLAEIGNPERIDMRNWRERGEAQAPVNISMKAMFNKEVKQAYEDKLNAKAMLETATSDFATIDIDGELTKAKDRLANEIRKFEHHQGIQTRLSTLATYDNAQLTPSELRPFDKATYENIVNHEPVAIESINDIITKVRMGEPLSKQNETEYRYAKAFLNHTQDMRVNGTLEQLRQAEIAPSIEPKPQVATIAPLPPIAPIVEPKPAPVAIEPTIAYEPIQSQPATLAPIIDDTPHVEPMSAIDEYNQLKDQLAKQYFNEDLQAIRAKGKPLLQAFNDIQDNPPKPNFWGKVKGEKEWEEQCNNALAEYNKVKKEHDLKEMVGVTGENLSKAGATIERDYPDLQARYDSQVRERIINDLRERERNKAPLTDEQKQRVQEIKRTGKLIPDLEPVTQTVANVQVIAEKPTPPAQPEPTVSIAKKHGNRDR